MTNHVCSVFEKGTYGWQCKYCGKPWTPPHPASPPEEGELERDDNVNWMDNVVQNYLDACPACGTLAEESEHDPTCPAPLPEEGEGRREVAEEDRQEFGPHGRPATPPSLPEMLRKYRTLSALADQMAKALEGIESIMPSKHRERNCTWREKKILEITSAALAAYYKLFSKEAK